jgi:hypothetical protein
MADVSAVSGWAGKPQAWGGRNDDDSEGWEVDWEGVGLLENGLV